MHVDLVEMEFNKYFTKHGLSGAWVAIGHVGGWRMNTCPYGRPVSELK
jgi:hypothetical protein